jgi:hypothetical protein
MSRLKCVGYGLLAVLVAIVGQSLLAPAYADTITLICSQPGTQYGINISIDTSASTAVAWMSYASRNDSPAFPATITSDQVTWTAPFNGGSSQNALDRTTGALNIVQRTVRSSWSCKKASPVF